MAQARHTRLDCSPGCSVEAAISLIDGKWKCVILFQLLRSGTLRFNEIHRRVPGVTQRMLTNQLRELEADGLIARQTYAEVPPQGGIQPVAGGPEHGTGAGGLEGVGRRQHRAVRQAGWGGGRGSMSKPWGAQLILAPKRLQGRPHWNGR